MATSKFSASIYILTCALKYFIVRSRRFIFVVRAKWNIYHFVARTYLRNCENTSQFLHSPHARRVEGKIYRTNHVIGKK